MRRKFIGIAAISVFVLSTLRAQDAKFFADNLKYSRDFYFKVHFVAIASLPASFKHDRYPSGGPERIQCDDGTYVRQHGRPWRYLSDKNENVLLHEFSGPLRLEGDKVVSGGATDTVRLGFGYMMRAQQGYEVSEFVWEEMQQARDENGTRAAKESTTPTAEPMQSSPHEQAAATMVSLLDGKLKIDIPSDFWRDPDDPKDPKTLAK